MTEKSYLERAQAALEEAAFEDQIKAHFEGFNMRLSSDAYALAKLDLYRDQFKQGMIALKAAYGAARECINEVFKDP